MQESKFNNDKLYHAVIADTEIYEVKEGIKVFNQTAALVAKKLGSPRYRENWRGIAKERKEPREVALANNTLSLECYWKKQDYQLAMTLINIDGTNKVGIGIFLEAEKPASTSYSGNVDTSSQEDGPLLSGSKKHGMKLFDIQNPDKQKPKDMAKPATYDFRKARWGMSPAEIESVEGEPEATLPEGRRLLLSYQKRVGSLDVLCTHIFSDGRLEAGAYTFMEKHSNENLHIKDFNQIENILQKKYGYKEIETNWKNNKFRNNPNQHGFAVAMGHLEYKTFRINGHTVIAHNLSGDNYQVSHQLLYKDVASFNKPKEEDTSDF